ncbi:MULTISPECIES: transposase [Pseudomonas]|uniref:transposase n=1 Tax=Pseudomonas sp. NY5710 TaxID=2662033 RepID=UPI00201713DC|nr:transposase [Pseudomonas sp. NY5710]
MIPAPDDLPDDPAVLRQLLAQLLAERTVDKGHIVDLKERIKLLRDRLFNRKSEQTVKPNTPQLALFNEPESQWMPAADEADEEVVAPTNRRGKRKPLAADLPRVEIIHDLPEHEQTCECGLPQACDWRGNQRAA